MLISVAICTYNRADLLEQTLVQMQQLEVPAALQWELLIVDNNCSDHTAGVVARHADKLPIRSLSEPQQGLSHARNCAIEAATGELLLWTDDDVLVAPNWLSRYAAALTDYPQADFFGAPVQPWFSVTPPDWLEANFALFAGAYAVRSAPPGTLALQNDELLPFGANFALRTSAIGDSRFDTELGRIGSQLISGEEVQFLSAMLERGQTGVWLEDAPVRHYIPADRLTEQYLQDYYYAKGQSRVRMSAPADLPTMAQLRHKLRKRRFKRWTSGSRTSRRWARGFKSMAMTQGMLEELKIITRSQ